MLAQTIEHYQQRSYQKRLRERYAAGYRRFIRLWHRRAGKGRDTMSFVLERGLQRVGVYYHIFPSLNQGRRDVWDNILQETKNGVERSFRMTEMFPGFGNPGKLLVKHVDDKEMQIELINNTLYQIVGADDEPAIERLRGPNPIGIILDEYAHGTKMDYAWKTLFPVLAENKGWVVFAYTPKGKNHGETRYNLALEYPETWDVQKLTVDQTFRDANGESGARVVSIEEVEAARREHGEAWVQQEFYCDFTGHEYGTIYGDRMRQAEQENRITDELVYIPSHPVGVCLDLGFSTDSLAMWFYQRIHGATRWIDYEESSQKDMAWLVRLLHARPYIYGRIVLPWDGQAAMEYLTLAGFRNVTKVDKRTSSLQTEIEKVRREFPTFLFHRTRCARGIECLRNYARKYDDDDQVFSPRPMHNRWSHGADALRTGIEGELEPLLFPGRPAEEVKVFHEFDPRIALDLQR